MPTIRIGDVEVPEAFVGDMGIKTICIGDIGLYTRPGGYLYIELTTETEE